MLRLIRDHGLGGYGGIGGYGGYGAGYGGHGLGYGRILWSLLTYVNITSDLYLGKGRCIYSLPAALKSARSWTTWAGIGGGVGR